MVAVVPVLVRLTGPVTTLPAVAASYHFMVAPDAQVPDKVELPPLHIAVADSAVGAATIAFTVIKFAVEPLIQLPLTQAA